MHARLCLVALALGCLLPLSVAAQSPRQQASRPTDPVEIAVRYLQQRAAALGVTDADVADLVVTDSYTSSRTGVTHVYVRQAIRGIEVFGTEMTVSVKRDGTVLHRAGTFQKDLAAQARVLVAELDAEQAVRRAAALVGMRRVPTLERLEQKMGAGRATIFAQTEGVATRILSRLVFTRDASENLRLSWQVELAPREQDHLWHVYVDAVTGAEVRREDLTVYETFGHTHDQSAEARVASLAPVRDAAPASFLAVDGSSYNVYPLPIESPSHGSRAVVTDPANPVASPFGWHDTNGAAGADYTITRGNNVYAYLDRNNDNGADAGSAPDGGAGLVFDFPVNLSQDPTTYQNAAVTNLFYWNNIIHDVFYQYGFDEAAGNFQQNNYGKGGVGGDYVNAEAQDGGGTNNANFATPTDGSAPRMQMYLWDETATRRDGDLDAGIVIHEYTHGLSNRLTGGPSNTSCLGNSDQMGEGWSDFYAAMLTMKAGDTRTTNRGIGTYSIGEPTTGVGIRPAPYNTNFAVNDYTYGDTRGACFLFCAISIPHGVGFIWATILWEATWDLIDRYGFDADIYNANGTAGNQIMLNLVTEGMKMQPCNPGFVSGRDAILAADDALYGGAHKDILWAAFARRGLGYSAAEGSTNKVNDNREAFDLPPTGGNVAPNAVFTYACDGLSCAFTDASTDPDGTVTAWAWTFGDGGSASTQNASHTFAAAGTYSVTLTVTDDDGATDGATQSVTVTTGGGGEDTAPPVLAGSIRNGKYEGTATDTGSGVATVTLAGDAQNLSLAVPSFVPGAPSVAFTVSLVNRGQQGKGYVNATDLAGNASTIWVCSDNCAPPSDPGDDTTPPVVSGSVQGNKFQGTASDAGSGIASVALAPGAVNLTLTVNPFMPGATSVGFTVKRINARQPGSGTVVATDVAGNTGSTVVNGANRLASADATELPDGPTLIGNYPNPFNPTTTIRYALAEATPVNLVVYDVTGREVARLVEGTVEAGFHEATFDASALPSGIYVYRLSAGTTVQTQKMILMK